MIYKNSVPMQYLLMMLILLSQPSLISAFTALTDLVRYSHTVPENIQETDIAKNVMYNTWFNSIKKNIIESLGFKRDTLISAKTLEKLLKEIYHQRELDYPRGRFIQKILPSPDSSLVVWGELEGAFHSLIRDLQQLKEMGLINDQLKILSKSTYFIFNGNVIGISPYALETLTIILYLMHQNPRNVIYIKGYREDKEHWMDLNLIKKFDAHMNRDSIDELLDLLRKFFSSLPLALYLVAPDQRENDDKKVVRISYFAPESLEFEEMDIPYFFDIYADSSLSLSDKVYKKTSITPHVVSSIYVESPNQELISSKGLALRSKDPNTAWLTVSSPTNRYKGLYQFFNDAFVIIKTAAELSEWTVTLYYQDVRKLAGFAQDPSQFLVSGNLTNKNLQERVVQLSERLNIINKNIESIKKNCVLPQILDSEQSTLSAPVSQETSFYDYKLFKHNLGLNYVNQFLSELI
jgi:hypothetical protein